MKKSIFLNTLRLLLLTAAAALFAPDNALGQNAVFKASFYGDSWSNEQEKEFSTLEEALTFNYRDYVINTLQLSGMYSNEITITQLSTYDKNEEFTLSEPYLEFKVQFEKELSGSLNLTLQKGNLSIKNTTDDDIQASFTVNDGILSINGGKFSRENNVVSISSGQLNINGLTTLESTGANALEILGGIVNITSTQNNTYINVTGKTYAVNMTGGQLLITKYNDDEEDPPAVPVLTGGNSALNITGGTASISYGQFKSSSTGKAAIVNATGNNILTSGFVFYNSNNQMIFHKEGENYLFEKYNADNGLLASDGTTLLSDVKVDRGAVFAASDGADTKYFTTLEKALTYDSYTSNEITVSLIQDYECYEKYFGKHGSYDGIEYLSLTKSFILDFTKFSIQDSLTATISGSKTLTIKGNSNTNLYASFHLEGSSTLNLNGGNYDFYTEIVKISSGCTANISDNVNFVASQEYSYASMAQYAAKRYDMFIENQGTLNITNGSFSYGSKTKNNDNDAKGIYNDGGTVTIEDGTIKTDYGPAISNENSGTVKISGGKFSGNNYGISASLDTETELSGGEFSGSTSAVFNGNGIGNSVLKTGYAFYDGEEQIEENYEEDKTLANSTTSEAYKKVSVNLAGAIILGKGAKYKVAGTFSDYNADADKAQGVWAEQSGGQWYIMTSSAVSEGSYTVTESETNTIKIQIKDYFKDVLEQEWYRSIGIDPTQNNSIEFWEYCNWQQDGSNYVKSTINTKCDLYVNGVKNEGEPISYDAPTEITYELKDGNDNIIATKTRTLKFDNARPRVIMKCDGVEVPAVSSQDDQNNYVDIFSDSKIEFIVDDSGDDGTIAQENQSGYYRVAFNPNPYWASGYNFFTPDELVIDLATMDIDLNGKTAIYCVWDKAGNGPDYGDSLKVTFRVTERNFIASYKASATATENTVQYFGGLESALDAASYPSDVTNITISPAKDEITTEWENDIEVKDKNFTFITNGKNVTATCRIKVTSGKLTINGGTFKGTSRPFAA
ncbi:MAG: hypothetical protein IKQ46_06010, partial [Bacteroidales bacterium]|nr:hypothetical protein [Bacteroidales bacterium]MBR6278450.1 hypothetical protein [Bacteroidales bacterium]